MSKRIWFGSSALCAGLAALAFATWLSMRDFPDDLSSLTGGTVKSQVLARDGTPLSYTLENDWNSTDVVALSAVPALLQTAVIVSEDQHFYEHSGVDWAARLAAAALDVRKASPVRGASSITEQVVRMVHPRPRNLWSRWVEGFEAMRLNARMSKAQILEFYLNQVPYADRRHGVAQAARLYFRRGLDTLSPGEQLSLAVLVRSPVGMDLRRNRPRALWAVNQLADRMSMRGQLSPPQREQIRTEPWVLNEPAPSVEASHFVARVLGTARGGRARAQIHTTLDPHIQLTAQQILDSALAGLARRHVQNAALLVIDHSKNEVLAWVVGGATTGYDTVLTPRQPGSTMKPLLYALALERGWTAATLIDDSDLSEAVGAGQHTFHNYSHRQYGLLRLREALGNSLNIPAVKTLKFVGEDAFMDRLHLLGIHSLTQHSDFYGDGLALGNGEVSLYEMAQAYTVLARRGRYRALTLLTDDPTPGSESAVFTPGVATLIGNIMADPDARMLEFGRGLQFPVDTAIKTGTSTDYRDAWAIAFDYRHTVAVWMGNLDGSATNGVTGAVGPAMVLRSVFSQLNRDQDTRPLTLSRDLVRADICRRDGRAADGVCPSAAEWFVPGTMPVPSTQPRGATGLQYRLLQPTAGLLVAHDPRIPSEFEALPMQIAPVAGLQRVEWFVDGELAASRRGVGYAWPLQRGTHTVHATVWTCVAGDGAAGDGAAGARTVAAGVTDPVACKPGAAAGDPGASAHNTDNIRFHVN